MAEGRLINPYTMTPIAAQTRHRMTLDKLKRFMEFEDLLRANGWQIICANCTRIYGPGKDGVRGDNDVTANTYKVECSCSVHIFDASTV